MTIIAWDITDGTISDPTERLTQTKWAELVDQIELYFKTREIDRSGIFHQLIDWTRTRNNVDFNNAVDIVTVAAWRFGAREHRREIWERQRYG